MTNKEKQIVKQLGYTPYILYQYIKSSPAFTNKDMQYELGTSPETTHRAFKKLKEYGIVKVKGKKSYSREFEILPEDKWKI